MDLLPNRWERMLDTTVDVAATYGLRALGAIAIIVVGYFVARMVKSALMRAGNRAPHVDFTVVSFVSSLAKYAVLIFTLIAVLSAFGVQTASIVAVIGAAGLAIGLALQGTLSHVASGFMLILFRPFRVGDTIETAGVSGTVTEVSLFTTEINSPDNIRIVIPNGQVWSGVTKNLTSHHQRRCDLELTITAHNDFDEVLALIRRIADAEPRVLKAPAPTVGIGKQNETGVKVWCQVWCKVSDFAGLQLDLHLAILKAFKAAEITMPPQQPRPFAEPKPAA